MPATAGRVRMPANNRVHSSAALQTHGIWQSAIGYDPYAPEKDSKVKASDKPEAEGGAENAYASFQGLLALARITGSSADDTRGACKKCGRIGHLTFQCRNFLSVKEDREKDDAAMQNASAVFDKIKKASGMKKGEEESSEEEDEESESSDSGMDSEIERIIAARNGKNKRKTEHGDGLREKKERRQRSRKRSGKRSSRASDQDSEDEKEEKRRRKEKRRRPRQTISDDGSDEENRGQGKNRRKRRASSGDDSSSDEDYHRRHHRHRPRQASSDDGGDQEEERGHGKKRRKRRTSSDDDSSSDEDYHRRHHGKSRKEKKRKRSHRR